MLIDKVGPRIEIRVAAAQPRPTPTRVPAVPTVAVWVTTWTVIRRADHPSALRVPNSRTLRPTDARVRRAAIEKDAASAAAATQMPRLAAIPEAVTTAPPTWEATAVDAAAWSRPLSTRDSAAPAPEAVAEAVMTTATPTARPAPVASDCHHRWRSS